MNNARVWGILTLIGAFLFNLAIGYNYTIGNMSPYLIQYMHITSGQSVWFNALLFSGQAVSMPVGGLLKAKFGFRVPVLLAIFFSSGGIYLSRLTIDYGFGPFIFTYCIMFGFGMGLPYSVLFSVASSWFPEHRALVVGLIAAGFGLGALVFTPIQTVLINPQNIGDFSQRIPNSFLIIASIILAMEIIAIILCRENKENVEKKIPEVLFDDESDLSPGFFKDTTPEIPKSYYGKGSISYTFDAEEEQSNQFPKSFTVKEALCCPDFYIIWSIFFLNIIPVMLQSSTYKLYGKEYVEDDQYLSAIATTTSAFNCIGRIAWGLICDKYSFKCPLGVLLVCWAALLGSFPFIDASGIFAILYPIWIFLLYLMLAGNFVLMPGATARIFGPKNMATIYGLIFCATVPSSLGLSAIISQYDIKGKWDAVYLSCAAVCVIGFCLMLFLRDDNGTCRGVSAICVNVCNRCRKEPGVEKGEPVADSTEISYQ